MKNFEGFGLSKDLNASLSRMNYTTPTDIQAKAIPLALKGRDILGSAQTGTGKTAAFAIPMVEALLRSPHGNALVLTPTRELAKQVLDAVHDLLGRNSNINTAFIIGGEGMGKQFSQLRANPRIIVGTPGRINDHLERGSMNLKDTSFLVLDETDRMLDMGFGVQLDRIVKFLPKERQTLMFSATLPKSIIEMSGKYLTNPERVSVGETNVVVAKIEQEAIRIEQGDKYKELIVQMHARTGSVIVFVKTKHNADKMSKKLRQDGFTSDALHGDLRQSKRDKVMKNFHNQNFRILVATDIAARGLDVPHIEHVVNYDLPQVAEDFIHRMGRTARAGAKGSALSFISPQDGRKWHAIEMLINPDAKKSMPPSKTNKSRRKPYRGRPEKSEFGSEKRFDKRRDSRSEQRPDNRQDNRPDNRQGKKHEERSEGTGEKRSYKAKSHHRGQKPGAPGAGDRSTFVKPRGAKPGHSKSSNAKPGESKPSYGKPSHAKSGQSKPSHGKPSHGKPSHGKPSHAKPSHTKSGYAKPGKKNFKGRPQHTKAA